MGDGAEIRSLRASSDGDRSDVPPYGRPAADNHQANETDSRPEFIGIPEWARRVGVSPESAYKAARLGQIPGCFNIGRLYRVNWPVFVAATSSMRSGFAEG